MVPPIFEEKKFENATRLACPTLPTWSALYKGWKLSGVVNDLQFGGRRVRNNLNGSPSCPADKFVTVEKMKLKQWLGQSTVACALFFASIVYRQQLVTKVRQFRDFSGDVLDSQWKTILGFFGNDDYYLYVWGCILCIQIPFWTVGGMFMFMDYFNWPKWVRKYKVQPGTNEPVDLSKLKETIKVVLINQWTIGNPLIFISFAVKKLTNTMPAIYELPTLQRFLIEMAVLFIVDEIALYYVHRLMHHPKLYSWVHKKHHEWHAPVAISVVYTTKTENLLITGGTGLGPFLMNPHLVTLWIWYALVHLRGLKNHCGYNFPWLPTPEDHDYHHMMNNACFGRTLALDWLHGTDKGFRAYQARKKNSAGHQLDLKSE